MTTYPDQTPLALHHYNTAASAMQQNDHSTAIHHFDECLCTNPHAEIAIAAWFNLWGRYGKMWILTEACILNVRSQISLWIKEEY